MNDKTIDIKIRCDKECMMEETDKFSFNVVRDLINSINNANKNFQYYQANELTKELIKYISKHAIELYKKSVTEY